MLRSSGLILIAIIVVAAVPSSECSTGEAEFQAGWQSLKHYQCPEWYRNAKFGIFMHWGPCSVPTGGNDGWYGRQMYMQQGTHWGNAYAFHVKTYGHPSQVGYKDIIPLWKAERWDPDELAVFYRKIGARYVVPVAVHHDNFDCYASTYQPWNSVNMGPKRDIIGESRTAVLKAGLRFGVSSHSDRSWGWFQTAHGADTTGPMKGVPYDGGLRAADGVGKWWNGYDPQDLYCPPESDKKGPIVAKAVDQKWYSRTLELVDKYQPDLLYFDGSMPMGDLGLQIAAHLYNSKLRNGRTDAVVNIKWDPPLQAVVDDQEKGLADGIRPQPWQVDASINSMWFADDLPLEMSAKQIIDALADTVSKNGNLLLNVALAADGTLSEAQRRAPGGGREVARRQRRSHLRDAADAHLGRRPDRNPPLAIGGQPHACANGARRPLHSQRRCALRPLHGLASGWAHTDRKSEKGQRNLSRGDCIRPAPWCQGADRLETG